MPFVQVIALAVVQGLTEFLPISSTAHLYLTSWLLGWNAEGLDFDIALHIGTLLAVLIYFFKDWLQIIGQGLGMNVGGDEELRFVSLDNSFPRFIRENPEKFAGWIKPL